MPDGALLRVALMQHSLAAEASSRRPVTPVAAAAPASARLRAALMQLLVCRVQRYLFEAN